MRVFNSREGLTSKDDRLPKKLFKPLTGGPSDGSVITEEEFINARQIYYKMAGWTNDGKPTNSKLSELGLTSIVGKLD
jgi:aldehyde:ferredoxin oxidoreductase